MMKPRFTPSAHNHTTTDLEHIKSDFVYIASHQLRTPLTAIKLSLELLLQEHGKKMEIDQLEYLKNIYQSTNRMVHLVDDLLQVSRIESGTLKTDPVFTNIKILIADVLKELEPILKAKQCTFALEVESPIPSVSIDPKLFRIVLHNLLDNAIKYTDKSHQSIRIFLHLEKNIHGKFLCISIQDRGITIPKNAQVHIFKKFFRADNALKVQTEGTGLGLYVSKLITELSGGTLTFSSDQKKGTTFFIHLPVIKK